jgi:DNA-directed RNA polymerase specialized sigma subunit
MSVPLPNMAPPSLVTVWRDYARTGDVRLRDRLAFTLAPLVRHAGARTQEEASAGLSALLAAIDSFAPERHGALELYAWARVRAVLGSR